MSFDENNLLRRSDYIGGRSTGQAANSERRDHSANAFDFEESRHIRMANIGTDAMDIYADEELDKLMFEDGDFADPEFPIFNDTIKSEQPPQQLTSSLLTSKQQPARHHSPRVRSGTEPGTQLTATAVQAQTRPVSSGRQSISRAASDVSTPIECNNIEEESLFVSAKTEYQGKSDGPKIIPNKPFDMPFDSPAFKSSGIDHTKSTPVRRTDLATRARPLANATVAPSPATNAVQQRLPKDDTDSYNLLPKQGSNAKRSRRF